jgi:hypothetical protein
MKPERNPIRTTQSGVRTFENNSGSDCPEFGILKVDDVVFTPTDNANYWNIRQIFDGNTPTDDCIFGIAQTPIKDTKSGPVMLSGVTPCTINVSDENHGYAIAGTSVDKLESASSGSAQILWKESGTGDKNAVVRIGNSAGGKGISAAWANVSIGQPAQTGGQSTGEAVLSGSLTNDSSRFDSQSGINLKNAGYYHGVLSGELTYRVRADEITQEQIVYRTNPGQWLYQSGTIERRQATPPSGMQYVDGVVIDAWKSPILGGRVLPTVAVESFNDTQATLVASDNDANNPFTGVIDIAFALTWFGRAGTGWVFSASTEMIDMKMKVGAGTVENLRTRLEDHSFTSRNNIQASDIVAPQGPVGVINPDNTVLIKQPIEFHQDFFSSANQKFTYQMDQESLLTISSGGGTSGLFGNVTFSGHTSVFWLGTSAT